MPQIHPDDEPHKMADIIFNEFELNQSCSIIGFTIFNNKPKPKGEIVCDMLRDIDRRQNMRRAAGGKDTKMQRKNVKPKDSIGGYAAHKIFRFKLVFLNDEPKYTIWRIQ